MLVGELICALKAERQQTEAALATLDLEQRQRTILDLDDACAILEALPDVSKSLAEADPELRRYIYEALQFAVELDRNTPEVRMKALVSSAFGTASDLDSIAATVAHKTHSGVGIETEREAIITATIDRRPLPGKERRRAATRSEVRTTLGIAHAALVAAVGRDAELIEE